MLERTMVHLMTGRQLAGPEYHQCFSDRIEQLEVWIMQGRDEHDAVVREAWLEWLQL